MWTMAQLILESAISMHSTFNTVFHQEFVRYILIVISHSALEIKSDFVIDGPIVVNFVNIEQVT